MLESNSARLCPALRIATTTSGSVISAMTRRRPPQGEAEGSTSWVRLSSVVQSVPVSILGPGRGLKRPAEALNAPGSHDRDELGWLPSVHLGHLDARLFELLR
jgi:hypothetical protein